MTHVCNNELDHPSSQDCCAELDRFLDPELFRALSDPNRLALLVQLAGESEPSTVSRAAGCCTVDLSVVSRHLQALRRAGVVQADRRGREVHYSLRFSALADALRSIADALDACRCSCNTPTTTASLDSRPGQP